MTTRRDEMKSNETNAVVEIRPGCQFPGCNNRLSATGRPGRRRSSCDHPDHNAQSAFRARQNNDRAAAADLPITTGLTELGHLVDELTAHRAALAELLADTDATLQLVTNRAAIDHETAAIRAAAEAEIAQARARQAEAEHAVVLMRTERDAALAASRLAEEAAEDAITEADTRINEAESAAENALSVAERIRAAAEEAGATAKTQLEAMQARLDATESAKQRAETRADEMARVANGRRIDAERLDSILINERKAHSKELSAVREQLDQVHRRHVEDLRGAMQIGRESARHLDSVRRRSPRPGPTRVLSSAKRRVS